MSERFLFFNSTTDDKRKYQAQDFAEYFGSVLSTGLLHTDDIPGMKASVEAGTLNTIISPGKAIMCGHLYSNTEDLTLEHIIPEPDTDRIDRIVLRLDLRNAERNILLHVKEGASAADPIAPELQRDNFIHEISLAQIRVKANTSQLQQSDLIDERLKEGLCGLVYSLISIPTSQFQAQWDLFFSQKSAELQQATDDYEAHVIAQKQAVLNNANQFAQSVVVAEQRLQDNIADFEQRWDDWFSRQQTEGFVLEPDFMNHLAEDATLAQKGHVILSNATDSADETKAATSKAVKEAITIAIAGEPWVELYETTLTSQALSIAINLDGQSYKEVEITIENTWSTFNNNAIYVNVNDIEQYYHGGRNKDSSMIGGFTGPVVGSGATLEFFDAKLRVADRGILFEGLSRLTYSPNVFNEYNGIVKDSNNLKNDSISKITFYMYYNYGVQDFNVGARISVKGRGLVA